MNGKSFSSSWMSSTAAAHEALDGIDGALWSFDQILAGGVADDDLVVLVFVECERDDRRNEIQPVFSGDDDRSVALHVGHERVRGAEIDADYVVSCHFVRLQRSEVRLQK